MAVTRCVCHQRCFRDIARLTRVHGWTAVSQIGHGTRAGTGCGACIPYLDAILRTGHTVFAVAGPGQTPLPCDPDPWDRAPA
jgi:NAD(P)H-nitrite reductase large subunit